MESTLSGRAATIGDNGLCVRAGAYVCVLVRACVCARASIMSVLITVQVDPTLGQCAGSTTEFRQCCNIMLRASFSSRINRSPSVPLQYCPSLYNHHC